MNLKDFFLSVDSFFLVCLYIFLLLSNICLEVGLFNLFKICKSVFFLFLEGLIIEINLFEFIFKFILLSVIILLLLELYIFDNCFVFIIIKNIFFFYIRRV